MKMYYEDDVDASIVADKTIAVMGYGSQGRGQSRNMADSGLNVIIGLRKGGSSWQKAVDDGMNVMTVEEAAEKADIIHILLPELNKSLLMSNPETQFHSLTDTTSTSV